MECSRPAPAAVNFNDDVYINRLTDIRYILGIR